jgi:multidrug efflux pump subunit AcrA (membrane-fusion protein)
MWRWIRAAATLLGVVALAGCFPTARPSADAAGSAPPIAVTSTPTSVASAVATVTGRYRDRHDFRDPDRD